MRIVIPTNDDKGLLARMGAHFGKANFYTIVELDENGIKDVEVVKNPGHGAGGCSNAVTNILSLNPDALIVVGIGPNPAMGFNQAGLPLFVDKESLTVEESINKLLNNQLPRVANRGTCGIKS
jgi:predicted Fe-Mo cluster-binding NifX family protein